MNATESISQLFRPVFDEDLEHMSELEIQEKIDEYNALADLLESNHQFRYNIGDRVYHLPSAMPKIDFVVTERTVTRCHEICDTGTLSDIPRPLYRLDGFESVDEDSIIPADNDRDLLPEEVQSIVQGFRYSTINKDLKYLELQIRSLKALSKNRKCQIWSALTDEERYMISFARTIGG